MNQVTRFGDFIQPFQIESVGVRGRLVRLGPAIDAMLRPHGYPPPVASLLAEAASLTVVLASGLKYDGVFTFQVHGDGPVGLMVADITSDGTLRGYARYDAARLEEPRAAEGPVPRLLGAGHMAFTVDQGPDTERYQGITALEGATLGECAHHYFRQSDQVDAAITLAAAPANTANGEYRAAALSIQRLPPQTSTTATHADPDAEDDWRRAVILMSSATPEELLDPALSAEGLLLRLFHVDGVRAYRRRPLRHGCRCSRNRVVRTLAAFPLDELATMADDGIVTVVCEFCKADYTVRLDEMNLDASASSDAR